MFKILKYCSMSEIITVIKYLEKEESNGSLLARFALIEFRQYLKFKIELDSLQAYYQMLNKMNK